MRPSPPHRVCGDRHGRRARGPRGRRVEPRCCRCCAPPVSGEAAGHRSRRTRPRDAPVEQRSWHAMATRTLLTNGRAISATSRQPWSIVSESPGSGRLHASPVGHRGCAAVACSRRPVGLDGGDRRGAALRTAGRGLQARLRPSRAVARGRSRRGRWIDDETAGTACHPVDSPEPGTQGLLSIGWMEAPGAAPSLMGALSVLGDEFDVQLAAEISGLAPADLLRAMDAAQRERPCGHRGRSRSIRSRHARTGLPRPWIARAGDGPRPCRRRPRTGSTA